MNRMYYDDYSNGCVLVPKPHHKDDNNCCETPAFTECKPEENTCCKNHTKRPNQPSFLENILPNFSLDDIILIALIFIFLNDGCEDKTLLLIIGAIFLLGFN